MIRKISLSSPLNESHQDSNQIDPRASMGLEKHVQSVFLQTQNTITSLTNDLDMEKMKKEEFNYRLQDLLNQKENLTIMNKNIEEEIRENKKKCDENLKIKNDAKNKVVNLKKELSEICNEWGVKKKELIKQINDLKEEQLKILDDKNKEISAHQQASALIENRINNLERDILKFTEEKEKYLKLINLLDEKEKYSKESILNETLKFRSFLDQNSQVDVSIANKSMKNL